MAITKKKPRRREVEDLMDDHLRFAGITGYVRDTPFVTGRRFRADFWFPDARIALEVDGGVFMPKGGHTTGLGYTADRERDIEAALQGIQTLRYTSEQVRKGYAIETFAKILKARTNAP